VANRDEEGVTVETFYTYAPPPPLSAYVERFWLHEENAPPHVLERALPTGKSALWIELGGAGLRVATQQHPDRLTTFRTSTLLGPHSGWYLVAAGYNIARMGAQFTPIGAAAFFVAPASDLYDAHVPLDALWGDAVANEFRERLLAEPTPAARFHQLERLLLERLTALPERPAVTFAVNALLTAPQAGAITQVVDQIALSHQQLIRLFRQDVGMTPKRFGRVRRFQAVLGCLGDEDHVNWAEIACACGYSDQAHLIRDFHEFAGVSPTAYLRDCDARFPKYLPHLPYTPNTPNTTHDPSSAALQAHA